MLSDHEIEQATAQLADFRGADRTHHTTLSELLEKYDTLMQDYKRLRSDLEEERDSRERYKKLAKGQERNPFVLVLVDGDGYIFDDDLIGNGADGGQRAAQFLNERVKSSMRDRGLEHCRVMVRVYANLVGLSKTLSRLKLAGPEKRSLAPFTASFTRSNDLFDFVDAGELKENADFKIRAMFRQFVENVQCRHIYFAACHDSGYVSELTPYIGNRDRITLVRTPAFHREFSKLNLRVEDFPNIFRTQPIDDQTSVGAPKLKQVPILQQPSASTTDDTSQVCSFFQKGLCKYGKNCRYLHVKSNANGHSSNTRGMSDIKNGRQTSSGDHSTVPFGMSNLAKSDNDFMSGNFPAHGDPVPTQFDFATMLPHEDSIPAGQIPINKTSYRLDSYLDLPEPEDRASFNARTAKHKLCNHYHINGACQVGDDCPYDHRPASPAIVNCLKQVILSNPCPRRGACRNPSCLYGHICQKADCKHRGGNQNCKFPAQIHYQDLKLAQFVPGNHAKTTTASSEDAEGESVSGWSLSPPPTIATSAMKSPRTLSDGEAEEDDGALLDLGDDASLD